MAILAIEGFEGAGTTNGSGASSTIRDYILSRYRGELRTSGNGVIRIEDGHGGGKALSWGGDSDADTNWIDIPLNKFVTECFVGFWFKPGTNRESVTKIIKWRHSNYNATQIDLRILDNSVLQFFTGDFAQLPVVVHGHIKPNVWTHIEIRVVIHASAGIIQIRINGEEVVNATGLDTLGGTDGTDVDVIRIQGGESSSNTDLTEQWMIDDIVILDTSGSDNITFLGLLKVEGLLPTAEGATIDFTPSSGVDNALMVDDNPEDGDTTYNESTDTPSNKDLLATANLSNVTGNVRAVQVTSQARVTEPGPVGLQSIVAEGTPTQETGAVVEVSDIEEYSRIWHIFEQNPDTSALWTTAEVNGMEIGYEID